MGQFRIKQIFEVLLRKQTIFTDELKKQRSKKSGGRRVKMDWSSGAGSGSDDASRTTGSFLTRVALSY